MLRRISTFLWNSRYFPLKQGTKKPSMEDPWTIFLKVIWWRIGEWDRHTRRVPQGHYQHPGAVIHHDYNHTCFPTCFLLSVTQVRLGLRQSGEGGLGASAAAPPSLGSGCFHPRQWLLRTPQLCFSENETAPFMPEVVTASYCTALWL